MESSYSYYDFDLDLKHGRMEDEGQAVVTKQVQRMWDPVKSVIYTSFLNKLGNKLQARE